MNNGVNTTNNNASSEQPLLQPMSGVTVVPANPNPVNASSQAQTSTPSPQVSQPAQTIPATTQATQSIPTVNQIVQPAPAVSTTSQGVSTASQPSPTLVTQPVSNLETSVQDNNVNLPKKKKNSIIPFLLLIIIGLGGYIYYITKSYTSKINQINYNCTPVTSSKEETKLDVNSTLIQDLYSKFATTIREDLAEPQFNDSMRLYLAYRQILETNKYDTDCKYYSPYAMEPFTCEDSARFSPKGFREETLVREIKKLYGESTEIALDNIQLGRSCIGGYQYVPDLHEYVQGFCNQDNATSFTVDKKVVEAISKRNTIIIKEEVKYHENERMHLPDSLRNGYYYYTFRLDMNYNYVLVSKTYESKYY